MLRLVNKVISNSSYVEIEQLKSFQRLKYCHIYGSYDHIRFMGEINEKGPVTLPECTLPTKRIKAQESSPIRSNCGYLYLTGNIGERLDSGKC